MDMRLSLTPVHRIATPQFYCHTHGLQWPNRQEPPACPSSALSAPTSAANCRAAASPQPAGTDALTANAPGASCSTATRMQPPSLPSVDAPALGSSFRVGAAAWGLPRVKTRASPRKHVPRALPCSPCRPWRAGLGLRAAAAARQRVQGCGQREARSASASHGTPAPPQGSRQRAQQLRRAMPRGPPTLNATRRLRHRQGSALNLQAAARRRAARRRCTRGAACATRRSAWPPPACSIGPDSL